MPLSYIKSDNGGNKGRDCKIEMRPYFTTSARPNNSSDFTACVFMAA